MKQRMINLKGVALAALTMVLALGAQAETIQYVAPVYNEVDGVANPTNGISHWVTNNVPDGYTVVTNESSDKVTWGSGGETNWYVVSGETRLLAGVTCKGHVNLVLCKDSLLTLVAPSFVESAGIQTDEDGSFTIYGTPDGAGSLEAEGSPYCAGIGGSENGAGENITINGGTVTATGGGKAAGIGGGRSGAGSDITINGGAVTATGGGEAAGIGGGYYGAGEKITINGGTVTSDGNAAGIGGGDHGAGEKITINGGTVTASGGSFAAGIGGGSHSTCENITINSGRVVAFGGEGGASIGGGYGAVAKNVTLNGGTVWATAINHYPNAGGMKACALIGNGEHTTKPSSSVVKPGVNIFFNLAGASQPMPTDFTGFVIMTPNVLSYEWILVDGVKEWTASPDFVLTNAVSGATTNTTVNPGEDILFAGIYLQVTHTNSVLNLKKIADMTEPIVAEPEAVDHTTRIVLTNGVESTETSVPGQWYAWSNRTATVVYRVDDGYRFADGSTEVTNTLKTTVDPAVLVGEKPAAPLAEVAFVEYLSPVYNKPGDATSGVDYMETNTCSSALAITSSATTLGASGRTLWYVVPNGTCEIGESVQCKGDVRLILAPGSKLKVTSTGAAGLSMYNISSALTLYGTPDGAGTIVAMGGEDSAGIGGDSYSAGRNITINGGSLYVANTGTFDLIGGNTEYYAATGTVVNCGANVFFNLTGTEAAEMEGLNGFVILTPEKPVTRILASGLAAWTAESTFLVTNAVSGVSTNVALGEAFQFGGAFCMIACESCTIGDVETRVLTFSARGPVCEILQQPAAANDYTIRAVTDGDQGITNYAWHAFEPSATDLATLLGKDVWWCRQGDFDTEGQISSDYVVWMQFDGGQLPVGGEFQFKCTLSQLNDYNYNTITPDDDGVFHVTPEVDGYDGTTYFVVASTGESFTLTDFSYVAMAEGACKYSGADMTQFPGTASDVGQDFVCHVTYANGDTSYTTNSVVFTYAPVPTVAIVAQPTVVVHTLLAVYTNGVLSAETEPDSGLWHVWSNKTACVVYSADTGYCYADGTIASTNELDTAVDPAVNTMTPERVYRAIALNDGVKALDYEDGLWHIVGKGSVTDTTNLRAEAVTNIVVDAGITEIGVNVFSDSAFWTLRDVTLGADCTSVGARAFKKCYGLTNVTSQATGTSTVGAYAFSGCHSLQGLSFAGAASFEEQAYTMQAAIYMKEGGIPEVYAMPTITVAGKSEHIMGKKTLADEWEDVTNATDDEKKNYHFFKIEMK